MSNQDERRKYPRSRRGIQAFDETGESSLLNHVDNISASGVLCHTIKPIALMTKLGMGLELPAPIDRRVDCEGVVVRCEADEQGGDNFKVAILYTQISDEDRDAIQTWVESDLAQDSDED
jgi:hypothetical protein